MANAPRQRTLSAQQSRRAFPFIVPSAGAAGVANPREAYTPLRGSASAGLFLFRRRGYVLRGLAVFEDDDHGHLHLVFRRGVRFFVFGLVFPRGRCGERCGIRFLVAAQRYQDDLTWLERFYGTLIANEVLVLAFQRRQLLAGIPLDIALFVERFGQVFDADFNIGIHLEIYVARYRDHLIHVPNSVDLLL